MNILNIPKEVFEAYLLPYLRLNDILRLRRTCQITKSVSDDYLKLHGHHLLPKIEVEAGTENERSLNRFLELGFSVSRIHLKNSNSQVLASDDVHELLEKHGSKIVDLFVDNFECCMSQEELNFYESLPKLKSVHFHRISLLNLESKSFQFPTTFRDLKSLKVDELVSPVMCPDDDEDYRYFSRLITFCHKVEYLNHPRFLWYSGHPIKTEYTNNEFLHHIRQLITNRGLNHPNKQNLKLYDLKEFTYKCNSDEAPAFLQLCRACTKFKVKLANVDSNFLFDFDYEPWRHNIIEEIEELVTPFQSVTNMHWLMFWCSEGKNLEEININSTAACSIAEILNAHPNWSLRKLALVMDSTQLAVPLLSEVLPTPGKTDMLFEFLLGEDEWPHGQLKELRLEFSTTLQDENPRMQQLERRYRYSYPPAANIIGACPNLKKLELRNWPGTNKELLKIWKALTGLEEILFDECQDVGNVTFVGLDTLAPVFLRMPRNLDKMPKITDLVFELVFRHLKLKHFILHSETPIKKVTVKGIRLLLTGEFANHIEKFPLNSWSLANLGTSDFRQLGSEFRSSQML